jgi:hypothetical protein
LSTTNPRRPDLGRHSRKLATSMGVKFGSLTLKEEDKLRVLENRVLRIFGMKTDEVTEGWRKQHNENLHNLYILKKKKPFMAVVRKRTIPTDCRLSVKLVATFVGVPNIIRMIKTRRMRWAGHVTRMGEEECIYDIGGKARMKETTRKTKM